MALDDREEAAIPGFGAMFSPFRTFRYVPPDKQHEERGQNAKHEHAAPAYVAVSHRIQDGRKQETAWIASLEQAGNRAPPACRNTFHRQRGADAPFAAHGNTIKRPQHEKASERWREARGELEHRVDQHIGHESGPPAEPVCQASKQKGAQRPCRQR